MVWISLVHSVFHYDGKSMDHGFSTNSRLVCALPLVSMQFLEGDATIMEVIKLTRYLINRPFVSSCVC